MRIFSRPARKGGSLSPERITSAFDLHECHESLFVFYFHSFEQFLFCDLCMLFRNINIKSIPFFYLAANDRSIDSHSHFFSSLSLAYILVVLLYSFYYSNNSTVFFHYFKICFNDTPPDTHTNNRWLALPECAIWHDNESSRFYYCLVTLFLSLLLLFLYPFLIIFYDAIDDIIRK